MSNIRITEKTNLRISPQVYYLIMDSEDGLYFNSTLSISRSGLPISVSALINQPIKTNIEIGNEFLWNLSLSWTFGGEYVENN